ncbi:hypothetical protein D3C76_974370 [compost metagenome]
MFILPGIFKGEASVFDASATFATHAVYIHAFASLLEIAGPLVGDVDAVNPGQAQCAQSVGVIQRTGGKLGFGLGAVIGFEPRQAAVQTVLATQAQYCSTVESMARCQVVGAAPIQSTVGDTVAQVRPVVVDQETTAQADDLAAGGNIHTVLPQ